MDPRERKRRRWEADRVRHEKRTKRKKLLIRLGIAAAVLLVCVIVLLLLPRGGGQPTEQETVTAPQSTQPDGQQTEPTQMETETTIRLVFGGDLNVTDGLVASGGVAYEYEETFRDIAHLLADADLAALNFEGIFTTEDLYGGELAAAPQSMAKALARAGVDVVQLANSCSLNKGLSGLATTVDVVRSAGMEPLGADKDPGQKGYMICQVQGIRVGLAAFTKGMDGLALPQGSEGCINVLYTDYDSNYQNVDTQRIGAVIDAMNRENPDITIVMLHWGSEFNDTISTSQKKILNLLQSKGVDAVVGTHPHYVQKMTYDSASGQFVAYCLGDLISEGERAGSEYSVLLELEITKDHSTGWTRIQDYSYTPVFTVNEPGKPVRVLRIHEAMAAYENGHLDSVSQQTYEQMAYALTRIEARIQGE